MNNHIFRRWDSLFLQVILGSSIISIVNPDPKKIRVLTRFRIFFLLILCPISIDLPSNLTWNIVQKGAYRTVGRTLTISPFVDPRSEGPLK